MSGALQLDQQQATSNQAYHKSSLGYWRTDAQSSQALAPCKILLQDEVLMNVMLLHLKNSWFLQNG